MRVLDPFPHRAARRSGGLVRMQKKPIVCPLISAGKIRQRDGVLREAPGEGHERRPTDAHLS